MLRKKLKKLKKYWVTLLISLFLFFWKVSSRDSVQFFSNLKVDEKERLAHERPFVETPEVVFVEDSSDVDVESHLKEAQSLVKEMCKLNFRAKVFLSRSDRFLKDSHLFRTKNGITSNSKLSTLEKSLLNHYESQAKDYLREATDHYKVYLTKREDLSCLIQKTPLESREKISILLQETLKDCQAKDLREDLLKLLNDCWPDQGDL